MSTPDPIAVESLHVAWCTLNATRVAIGIATVAAGLALWALIVAIQDARRNAKQLELALRSPKLEVLFYDEPHSAAQASTMILAGTNELVLPRTIAIRNLGNRTSHHIRVVLFVQRNAVRRESVSPHDDVDVCGTPCYRLTCDLGIDRLYPDQDSPPTLFVPMPQLELIPLDYFVVYWRAYDDFGVYPIESDGTVGYGELHVYSASRFPKNESAFSPRAPR